MAYITRAISDKEKLLVVARPHWIYILKALFWGALCVYGFDWLDRQMFSYFTHNAINFEVDLYYITFTERFTPIPYIGWGLGLALFWAYFSIYISHEIGLTDQRFIHKKGLLFISTEQADLDDIRAENVNHGLLGWLFRYGYVHLDSRFTEDMYLPALAHPYPLIKESHKARMRHPEIVYDQKNLDENLITIQQREEAARQRFKLKTLHDHILNMFRRSA